MTLHRLPLALLAAAALTLTAPLRAQDPDLRELLRDALYTEEVTRDPEAAAKQYEALLSKHDAQRAFAAAALFRLAEVRRKQDRKDEAIALYQRLLREFPAAEAESKLARENLAAMGSKPAEVAGPAEEREMSTAEWKLRNQQRDIEQLKQLAESSPDVLVRKLQEAVQGENPLIVEFLLSKGIDPGTPGVLSSAAGSGNLAICKLLLQKGKPSPEEAGMALSEAIRRGRMAILSYLLDQGLDPDSPVSQGFGRWITPLWVAVEVGSLEAAKALLDCRADIDFIVNPSGNPGNNESSGTALHFAVQRQEGLPMFRLLLERGAKPDLPTPVGGLTPLHFAAIQDAPDSVAMVSELLAKGADPNRQSTIGPDARQQDFNPFILATPFQITLELKHLSKLRAMLAKGADLKAADRRGWLPLRNAIESQSPELIRELLKAGADPNSRDANGAPMLLAAVTAAVESEEVARSPNEHLAARSQHREIVQALLEAGADPSAGHQGKTPLSETVNREFLQPIHELLLAEGAKPDAEVFRKLLDAKDWNGALEMLDAGAPLPNTSTQFPWESPLVRAMKSAEALPLVEKLIELGAAPDDAWVRSGFDWLHYGSSNSIEIAPPIRAFLFRRFFLPVMEEHPGIRIIVHGPVRTTATLLDDPSPPLAPRPLAQALLDPAEAVPDVQRILSSDRLILWRKSTGQWSKADEFALDRESGYPDVHRGDVLELVHGPDPANRRDQPGGVGTIRPELEWTLRKRVTFPVTVEIDGKAREVTLRGDRLLFDPGFDQVPLVGASRLASLLWQPEVSHAGLPNPNPEVSVVRNGWPDISVPWNPSSPADFVLQSDDRLVIKTPPPPDHTREWHVAVRGSGLPFVRLYGANPRESSGPNEVAAASLPTLIQALADVGSYNTETLRSAPVDPAVLPSWLLGSPDLPIQLLPHPDYSKIVIRRLDAEGKETKIPVDLAAVIANSTAVTTPEQARKADVELQAGDIVEIPQVAGQAGTPWKGFTEAESRFFAKALDCKVQVIDLQGGIELREIRYQAPRFIELAGQSIPLPPTSGTETLNAGWAIGQGSNTVKVTRMGKDSGALPASSVYLREGDVVKSSGRPPRARVVPSGR